mmetsp:Transcript_10884/g.30828  ORF Transcript_10884/g.30828 Transcript_10884/m.30828 type:complete len:472 (+) Transcript_10884:107-1522(+)
MTSALARHSPWSNTTPTHSNRCSTGTIGFWKPADQCRVGQATQRLHPKRPGVICKAVKQSEARSIPGSKSSSSTADTKRRELLLAGVAGSAALLGSSLGPCSRAGASEGALEIGSSSAALPATMLDTSTQQGKTAIVTGASSGIGFMVAVGLLQKGFTVIPAARSQSRTRETADRLLLEVPGGNLELLDEPCDLSSIHSVQNFASSYLNSGLPLDVLMECAGIAWCDESTSADGFELQFATNHLGHFHLANQLMPLLREAPQRSASVPRLVVMSSSAHYAGSCSPAALVGAAPAHAYNRWTNYCDSKLCNVLFAQEVARREPSVISTSVHPGVVNTDLIRYITPQVVMDARSKDPEASLRAGKLIGLRTPAEGAQGAVWLATVPADEEVSGGYYEGLAPAKIAQPAAPAQDPALATALWAASEVLVARALGEPEPQDAYSVASSFVSPGEDPLESRLPGYLRMQLANPSFT